MFQVLVGTLNSAKISQTSKLSEAALRRQQIEQRLNEKLAKERAELAEKIEQDKKRRVALRQEQETRIKALTVKLCSL
eukprot:jgi/Hompol1/444/HPOL_003242-RA